MFRTIAFAAIAGILTTFSSSQAVTLAHWDFEQYSDGSAIPLGFEVVPESALIMDVSGNGRHLSKPSYFAIPTSTTEGREPGTVAADFYGSCVTDWGECDYYEFHPQERGVDDINFGPTDDFTLEAIALIPLNLDREDVGPSYRLQEGGLVGKGGGGEGLWSLSILHRNFFPGTRGHRLETFAGRPFADSVEGTDWITTLSPPREERIAVADGWHHFAMVRTAGIDFKVYIDGEETGSVPDPGLDLTSAASDRVVVGTRDSNSNRFKMFSNAIDEVRISGEALSCGDFLIPCEITDTGVPGDYNESGSVDTADYTTWRDMLGQNVTPGTGPDGVADGTIDELDYQFWADRYGNTAGSSLGSGASVPEPTAMGLLMLVGLVAAALHRWR